MPIGTPFHPRTSTLCMSMDWRIWSGYFVASSYHVFHEPEYAAIRHAAALIDVSPLFKYEISGEDALKLVDRVITRDASKCAVNQVLYAPWCDEEGKVIQDGTIFRLGEKRFRMNTADPSLRWLQMNAIGIDVKIEDVSEEIAAVALQGPTARDILKQVSNAEMDGLKYFRLTSAQVDGVPVIISRTGYTGDLGYEIWVSSQNAVRLWDALMAAGKNYGIAPVGMLALDRARIEAGFILIGVDYISAKKALIPSQKSSPFEIGLGWTVNLEKETFVGRNALREEKERGSPWQLVGLEILWEDLERLYGRVGLPPQLPSVAWRSGIPVYADGRQVGRATSGCWSPTLKKYIALATLESRCALSGAQVLMEITVEFERKQARANVVKPPFFDPPRKRA